MQRHSPSGIRWEVPARLAGKLRPILVALLVLAVMGVMAFSPGHTPWEGTADVTVEGTWEMAETYSPVLRFSSGESAFPSPVEYFLERSSLVDMVGTVILKRPSTAELEGAGPLFLDFEAEDVIGTYQSDRSSIAPTIYARVAEAGGRIALQYWMFYVFNDGMLNSHEGDWEMVQVVLSRDGTRAESVEMSQHHSSDLVSWDSLIEVVEGTHPVVMVSQGSHANYAPNAQQLAYGDRADGLGEEWGPKDYSLVPIGTGAEGDGPAWLRYEGAWGAPAGSLGGVLGRQGPEGPMFREGGRMWAGFDRET